MADPGKMMNEMLGGTVEKLQREARERELLAAIEQGKVLLRQALSERNAERALRASDAGVHASWAWGLYQMRKHWAFRLFPKLVKNYVRSFVL